MDGREEVNIYISYSHRDKEYVDEFMKHMNVLRRSGLVSVIYSDQQLKGGDLWNEELKRYRENANIFIFFLSSDSLASDYINEQEIPEAYEKFRQGTAFLFPILLRPCNFSLSPLSTIVISMPEGKPVSQFEDRDYAWTLVLKDLLSVINRISSRAALKLIEQAKNDKSKFLDLGNCGLKDIPPELFELHWLEHLILGTNRRTEDYHQLRFFDDLKNEILPDGQYPFITGNNGAVNDFSAADLSKLENLPNLSFLNLESCNINVLEWDFSKLNSLKVLLAGNNKYTERAVKQSGNVSFLFSRKCPRLEVLNLSRNNLSFFPSNFFETIADTIKCLNLSLNPSLSSSVLTNLSRCKNLISLDLQFNNLGSTSMLSELTSIRWLDFSNNAVKDISLLSRLNKLEALYITQNEIQDLSPLAILQNLKDLHLSVNKIVSLDAISKLLSLEMLSLDSNQLADIEALKGLENLKYLNIAVNKVKIISAMATMKNLTMLIADKNEIIEIDSLANCKNLYSAQLIDNKISDIFQVKKLIDELPMLGVINVAGNPISNFDPSLIQHINKRVDFEKYLSELEESEPAVNNEVKLILVGNSTAGKSTLRRMIQEESFADNEGTTHGIVRDVWTIPNQNNDGNIKVTIWDFGGQEYYHETHKLFFSRNAVYVLMWEAATDKNEIQETTVAYTEGDKIFTNKKYIEHYSCEYWLKNIRHYAPNSPILVIQNKIDKYFVQQSNATPGAPKPVIRIKKISDECLDAFNITDMFDLSLEKVSKNDEDFIFDYKKFLHILKKRLSETASSIHLGSNFSKIKEEILKRKSENKWTKADFDAFCRKYDPDINLDLLISYLTDISVILYFKDREELSGWVFINPVWVSDQIYRVLDNKVLENSGHFTKKHIEDKLGGENAEEFIALMKQFQIIFEDEKRKEFVAPQYLPDSNINRYYNLVKAQFLQPRFVLEFPKFLPKTIMNNILSIYAGDAIESSYYKYGVAFNTDFDPINILEYDFKKNQISFFSKTDDQYNAREVFEKILSLFENIKISDCTPTTMDPSTQKILEDDTVTVLLSLDGETFVNWNKVFLGRSIIEDSMVLIPERGKEINKGAFSTYYLSKEELKKISSPTARKDTVKVFISYAHKDEDFKDELLEHLSGLKRQGTIQHWTDRAILPGEKWDDIIKKNLSESNIVLFLISPSFMNSDYIQDYEIKLTIEKSKMINSNVMIVPIPIRPCDYESLPIKQNQGAIQNFKPVSSWDNRDEAWYDVVKKLKMLITEKFTS